MEHNTGCVLCGAPILYKKEAVAMLCEKCGESFETDALCENGHYVCDKCHTHIAFEEIKKTCLATEEKDPYKIAVSLMKNKAIHMHGPEHHFLVPAVMLAALKNAGYPLDLERALEAAMKRAANVPGGFCGFYGCCGSAVGAGIFMSTALEATPLSEGESWALPQILTAKCLNKIACCGGPRCCKRGVISAIMEASVFANEVFGSAIPVNKNIKCGFFNYNNECLAEKCVYHPNFS